METIGERLKKIRQDEKMTQPDLAKLLGVEPPAISKYETDRVPIPQETIKQLSTIFNVSSDYLLGLTDIPKHDEVKTLKQHSKIHADNEIITREDIQNIIADTVSQATDETTKETIRAIMRIKDKKQKQKVLQLIRMFAEEDEEDN